MENVSFTFEDAQRISDTVQAMERSKYAVKPIDLTNQGDEFVVINVTSPTKDAGTHTQPGNLSFWNNSDYAYNEYSPAQPVRVQAANSSYTLANGFTFAKFQGNTGGVLGDQPLYVAISSSLSAGNAVVEVVTDVVVTPTGLELSTITLCGADYDSAIIKQFLALTDVTPSSFLGNQGRVVKVNDTATALEFGAIGEGPSYTTFIALSDSPATYGSSSTYYSLTVNSTNSAVVFSANNVTSTNSITGGGNPNAPAWTALKLVNDTATPGNNKYYGTSSSGVKGWQSIQAILDAIADLTARVTALEP